MPTANLTIEVLVEFTYMHPDSLCGAPKLLFKGYQGLLSWG